MPYLQSKSSPTRRHPIYSSGAGLCWNICSMSKILPVKFSQTNLESWKVMWSTCNYMYNTPYQFQSHETCRFWDSQELFPPSNFRAFFLRFSLLALLITSVICLVFGLVKRVSVFPSSLSPLFFIFFFHLLFLFPSDCYLYMYIHKTLDCWPYIRQHDSGHAPLFDIPVSASIFTLWSLNLVFTEDGS